MEVILEDGPEKDKNEESVEVDPYQISKDDMSRSESMTKGKNGVGEL